MQKGQTLILLLIGIVILVGAAGGAYYIEKINNATSGVIPVITSISKSSSNLSTSSALTVSGETTNWQTYMDQNFPYSIQYPHTWSLEVIKDALDIPTIRLKRLTDKSKDSYFIEIYVGGFGIYSTSGTICGNTKCENVGSLSLQIGDGQIDAPIFKIPSIGPKSLIYRSQFELPLKFGKTLPGGSLYVVPSVTVSYYTDEEKVEIVKILSTFRFLAKTASPNSGPVSEEEYRKLKEKAALTPLPTNVDSIRDNP